MSDIAAKHAEFICSQSPDWWLQMSGAIEGNNGSLQTKVTPNILQRRVLDAWMARYRQGKPVRFVGLKPRKRGFSTISTAIHYWLARMTAANIGILGHQDNASTNTLYRMMEVYRDHDRNAGNWGNVPTKTAGDEMRFSHGSQIGRLTAESPAKVRGETLQGISATEWAFWTNSVTALQAAMNAMPKGVFTSFIGESTPKGATGSFAGTFLNARWPTADECPGGMEYWRQWESFLPQQSNTGIPEDELFIRIFAAWFEFDDSFIRLTPAEMKGVENSLDAEDWYFGEQELLDRYMLTRPDGQQVLGKEVGNANVWEQLAWRRVRIRTDCDNNLRSFNEEYPSDPHTCIEENQRVATDHGLIKIKDVQVGMMTRHGRVVAKELMGVKPIVHLTTFRGFRLACTSDHRIARTDGSFVVAGQAVGEVITLDGAEFSDHEHVERWTGFGGVDCAWRVTPEFGRFLGYFMGDGSLHNATLSIACDGKDTDVIADVCGLMESFFSKPQTRVLGGGVEVRLSDKRFHELFMRLGIIQENTKSYSPHVRNVCVPECIWRSPREVVRQFLRGLFEADGWISATGGSVKYFAKNPEFSRDVQLLLLGFGVHSRLKTLIKKAGGKEYPGSQLDLYKSQTDNFMRSIGFVGQRKNSRQSIGASTNGRPAIMYSNQDTVVSVEPAGEAPVYDIQIDNRPVFSAQGILVHNCFLSSGNPFFDPESVTTLDQIAKYTPPPERGVLEWKATSGAPNAVWHETRTDAHIFHAWEHPKEGCSYLVAIDSATGENNVKGGKPDRHSVLVVRQAYRDEHGKIFKPRLVARVRPPCLVPLYTMTEWAARLATYYQALVVPEINNTGQAVVIGLKNFPHIRIARRYSGEDPRTGRRQTRELIGHLTDVSTRQAVLDYLHKYLRAEAIDIACPHMIHELRIFNHDPEKKRPEAPAGEHDDDVMAMAIALHWIDKATPFVMPTRRRADIGKDYASGIAAHMDPPMGMIS